MNIGLRQKHLYMVRNMQEPVDEAEAVASWIKLRDLTHLSEMDVGAGQDAMEHFFPQYQFHIFCHGMEQPGRRAAVEEAFRKKKRGALGSAERMKVEYGIYKRLYGSPVPPAMTKWIVCGLAPKTAVLDFAAGSGARCLAAMSLSVPFYGIVQSRREERKYMNLLSILDHKADVTISTQAMLDLSKQSYDVVVSASYELPLRSFFVNASRAWMHLMAGGSMALLMLPEEYEAAKAVVPPLYLESVIDSSKFKLYVWRKPKPKPMTRNRVA